MGEAWRSYGIVHAWPLFFYTWLYNPHKIWVIWGTVLTFGADRGPVGEQRRERPSESDILVADKPARRDERGEDVTLTEQISSRIESLPEIYQAQLLDFVEFLEIQSKKLRERGDQERVDWSSFSLSQAMRKVDGEEDVYSLEDLAEAY